MVDMHSMSTIGYTKSEIIVKVGTIILISFEKFPPSLTFDRQKYHTLW